MEKIKIFRRPLIFLEIRTYQVHKIRTREKTGYNEYDQHKLKRKAIKNLKENKQKGGHYH